MPEGRRLLGTQPGAACRDRLRAMDARLDALSAACTQRCEALLATLQHLPATARFEPFPATPPGQPTNAPPRQAPAPRGQTRRGAAQTPASPPSQSPAPVAAGLGQGAFAGVAEALRVATQPTARAALIARSAAQALASGSPTRQAAALAALPQAATLLVTELLARVPAPPLTQRPQRAANAPQASMNLADAQFGRVLGKLVAQGTGRPAPGQSAPARQARRTPQAFGEAIAAAMTDLLARQGTGLPPTPAAPPRLTDALTGPLAGGLLGTLLADLAAPASPAAQARRGANPPPRAPAPRAQPRLTENTPAAQGSDSGRQKAAPASDAQASGDGSELAGQLNRLLLDQAWLRGVDLT